MKMDHHCPWVNTCVGHENHAAFTRFVFYTPFGCLHSSIVCANFIYRLFSSEYLSNPPYFKINSFWIFFSLIGCTLGVGVALAVGILFYVQIKGILVNETQIEEWIIHKAYKRRIRYAREHQYSSSSEEEEEEGNKGDGEGRLKKKRLTPFVYPYNLGWRANLRQVINTTGRALGNGVDWPIREGCSKYDFTIEQLEQKKEKKTRTFEGVVQTSYDGSVCMCKFGISTCLFSPCSLLEGERIPVSAGNTVHITNWKSHWYYGDRILTAEERKTLKRLKGWFPRKCVDHNTIKQLTLKRD
jgi:palmitoyltransferase